MVWARLLAYATGAINRELLLKNEYLVAENRILKAKVKGRLVLFGGEKATLAEIAHRLGRKALEEVAATARPDTILGWYRKLIARKFDGSKFRQRAGRPKVHPETRSATIRAKTTGSCFLRRRRREGTGGGAVSTTTGRPAEVLREGSGIEVEGTAGDGLTISTYIKDTGNPP